MRDSFQKRTEKMSRRRVSYRGLLAAFGVLRTAAGTNVWRKTQVKDWRVRRPRTPRR